ncbi:MAG: adenosylcobinamide-GDP ribazoletransferase [Nitrospirota bacterium]|mgnify:CR=1 FL=1|jgi:adenosylcobinamide-GDP ribazoletransferase
MSDELRVTSDEKNNLIHITHHASCITQILLAIQFLTIIPVRNTTNVNEEDISKSTQAFVVVGIIQGTLLLATDYIAGIVFPHDLVLAMVLLVLVLSNGGFHLDGLADTFDATAVKSEGNTESDREKRLAVMKDGATGPAGVLAIVFVLAIKYLSLQGLSQFSSFTYNSSLLLMPVLPKWTMIISMFHGRPSMKEGLGRIFIGRIGLKEVIVSTLMLFLLIMLLPVFFSHYKPGRQYIFYGALPVVMYLLCHVWVNIFNKRFGGLNGDTLGAISEITEAIFLILVLIWARLFI